MLLGPHLSERILMLLAPWFFSVLPMPASGSGSFECAVFPSRLLSQSHKNRIRRGKKTSLSPTYSCLLSLHIQEKDDITILCKGITSGPHVLLYDLLFFYYKSLILPSHCFQRQYSILMMKYFTYKPNKYSRTGGPSMLLKILVWIII